jgi:hypothetical protein
MKMIAAIAGLVLGLMFDSATASAFQGRNGINKVDLTCTVSGEAKCTSFYHTTLDITILNNWNIGKGVWDGSANPAANSAQGIAAAAGLIATGLSGWVLPTGGDESGYNIGGPENQFFSIWDDTGRTLSGLENQFDGVRNFYYWSSSEFNLEPPFSLAYVFDTFSGHKAGHGKTEPLFAVAVRAGDVALPEPQTILLLALSLGAMGLVSKWRPHQPGKPRSIASDT